MLSCSGGSVLEVHLFMTFRGFLCLGPERVDRVCSLHKLNDSSWSKLWLYFLPGYEDVFFFLDFRSTLKGFNYTFLHDTTFYSRPDSDCKWLHGNVSGLSIEVNTHHRGRCVVFIKGCFFLLLWIKESHTTSYCQCHLTKSQQHVGHNYRALGRNPCLKLALRMH